MHYMLVWGERKKESVGWRLKESRRQRCVENDREYVVDRYSGAWTSTERKEILFWTLLPLQYPLTFGTKKKDEAEKKK